MSANVTIANWRTSPNNRWAFHHISNLIPVVEVPNDPKYSFLLKSAAQQINSEDFQSFIDRTDTDAIVVIQNGQVIHESYANGNDESSPHILMSVTKAVVGLVASILEHRQELDTGKSIKSILPELLNTAYQDFTLRELLDMRCGIVFDEQELLNYEAATNWNGTQTPGLHDFFRNLPARHVQRFAPFCYLSANTDVLGWAIERATGQSFVSLLSDLLWKPMGAEYPAYFTTDSKGSPRFSGGLCASARDLAKLGLLLLNNDKEDLFNNGDTDAWNRGEWGRAFSPVSSHMSYRNGWYMIHDQPSLLFAMGLYGQNLFIDKSNNLVVAKFSSWKEETDYAAFGLTYATIRNLKKMTGGSLY